MFNLYEGTKHEAGIIIYENGEVGVFNWAGCNDNQIPLLSPWGDPINWPNDDDNELQKICEVDDVREYLPDKLDVIYDANNDIAALLGADPKVQAELYSDCEHPYSGTVWQLGERRIITIDTWN